MKSEFREYEVFITRDGEEFMDDSAAEEHEEFLDAKDKFLELAKCDDVEAHEIIHRMRPYIEKVLNS